MPCRTTARRVSWSPVTKHFWFSKSRGTIRKLRQRKTLNRTWLSLKQMLLGSEELIPESVFRETLPARVSTLTRTLLTKKR